MHPLLSAAAAIGSQTAQPVLTNSFSGFRNDFGYNDIARARRLQYILDWNSTINRSGPNFCPLRFNVSQAIQVFNQSPWPELGVNPQGAEELRRRLARNLRCLGIEANIRDSSDNVPESAGEAFYDSHEWQRLIDMSCAAAPLGDVLRDWHRSVPLGNLEASVDDDDLKYNFERAQVRRMHDRQLMKYPWVAWTIQESAKLKWMHGLEAPMHKSLLASGGCTRDRDIEYAESLTRRLPDPTTLMSWASKQLWDNDIVQLLQLDDGWNESEIARFFCRAQGILNEATPFPNEPAGLRDWVRLGFRDARRVPSHAEAQHLQYKLRPSAAGNDASIIPGVAAWTPAMTTAALKHGGIPHQIAQQITGASFEAAPLHMLSVILTPLLEHPNVRQLAEQLYPGPNDWITEALKDHGFTQPFCELATAAIRQEATDKHNAEMIASRKAIEHARRDSVLKRYQIGILNRFDAVNRLVGPQYDQSMANNAINVIDSEVDAHIVEVKVGAIKDAFFSGQMNLGATSTKLDEIPIVDIRRDKYLQEWQWERTTNMKHQTTGEILAVMKAGLTTPAQTIQRLTNLGWANPDAIAEVALTQHAMQVTAAKSIASAQQHQAAAIQHAATTMQHNAAKAQRDAANRAKTQLIIDKNVAKAAHVKLLAQSEYFAKVHAANDRYKAAEKKNNQELMDKEIQLEFAAYQRWLLDQITLLEQGKEVQREIGPLDTRQAEGPAQSQGNPTPPTGATKPPGDATGPVSPTGETPAPG